MIRRLGGRRWQLLHRLTCVAAAAAVLHCWWLVKAYNLSWSIGVKPLDRERKPQ
jgi:DMSO/TMAO reductase YedYZ heme-binding membrane subunit